MPLQIIALPTTAVAVMSTLSLYGLARLILDLRQTAGSTVNVRDIYTAADSFMASHVKPHLVEHHLDIEAMHDAYMRQGRDGISLYLRDKGFSKNESHNLFLTNFIFMPRMEEYHLKFHELTPAEKPVKAIE